MASLCKAVAALLFFVSPLIHSYLFAHAASTSSPITRARIIFMTASDYDYNDEDDNSDSPSSPPKVLSSMKTPLQHGPHPCKHDPCLENQEPCARLAQRTGCRCPGMSGANEPPHPPRIQALLPISEGADRGKVEVQWCAPSSVVSSYRVVVEGSEAVEYEDVSRRGLVGSLAAGTKVCVEAVNNAGRSSFSEFSCKRYDTPESSDHKLLVGVIGGGVALLLLIVTAAAVLWKYQLCQRAKRNSADGLGNPSFSTGGTL
ncbi:LRRN4 C-terminal-like protein [Pholidichthys leucotaenia]